jgi:hypothetical protein
MLHIVERSSLLLKDDDDSNNKRGRGWNEVEKFCLFSTTGTVLELVQCWNWTVNSHGVSTKFIASVA